MMGVFAGIRIAGIILKIRGVKHVARDVSELDTPAVKVCLTLNIVHVFWYSIGYNLIYCFDIIALDVIFAVVVLFQKICSASSIFCICNRTVHTANPEHCYFVPFA